MSREKEEREAESAGEPHLGKSEAGGPTTARRPPGQEYGGG
jgi:hypothetical protein